MQRARIKPRLSVVLPIPRAPYRSTVSPCSYACATRAPSSPIFFFSSRRRHTRCGRDWSSDVCSSDLNAVDQANREVQSRFDFKGVDASFALEGDSVKLEAEVDFQLKQMLDVLRNKQIGRASCRERVLNSVGAVA